MVFKALTAILAILLIAETAYLVIHHSTSMKRFERTKEERFVALDTATGHLCATVPTRPPDQITQDGDTWLVVSLPQCSAGRNVDSLAFGGKIQG
jgi:hypothetical protein